jgi:CheY-like chemotaxis protein
MCDQKSVKIKLLIVEDNTLNHLVISYMLEALGYPFDTVDNGSDCLRFLNDNC